MSTDSDQRNEWHDEMLGQLDMSADSDQSNESHDEMVAQLDMSADSDQRNGCRDEMLEHCCQTVVHSEIWSIEIEKLQHPENTLLQSPHYYAGPDKELLYCLNLYPERAESTPSFTHMSIHPVLICSYSTNSLRATFEISMLNIKDMCILRQSPCKFSAYIKAGQLEELPTFSKFSSIVLPPSHNPITIQSIVSVSYANEMEILRPGYGIQPLIENLESLFLDRKYSDVTLVVNNEEIPAHKGILASRSPVFAESLKKTSVKVEIYNIDISVLIDFLLFLYTGKSKLIHKSPFNWKVVFDLLRAADKYQVLSLKNLCTVHLEKNLSVDNSCEILSLAVDDLKESAINFINAHRIIIRDTLGWKKMLETSPLLVADLYLAIDL